MLPMKKPSFLRFETLNPKSSFHHLWLPYVVFLIVEWAWKTSNLVAFLLYTIVLSLSISYPIISLAYYYLVDEVGLIEKLIPFVKDGKHITCHYIQRKKVAMWGCMFLLFILMNQIGLTIELGITYLERRW